MRLLLADIVLLIHFGLALFIVLGLVAICLGGVREWVWVRNLRFRVTHIVAITVVAFEGALGITCPLTLWEDWLRQNAGAPSFVARWVQRLLYYDLPEWVFAIVYVAVALATALAWIYVRPASNRKAP